jgi:hypothetical protein
MMPGTGRSKQAGKINESAEILQIYHDLEGVIRLGQIQFELLKSIQKRLSALTKEPNEAVKT